MAYVLLPEARGFVGPSPLFGKGVTVLFRFVYMVVGPESLAINFRHVPLPGLSCTIEIETKFLFSLGMGRVVEEMDKIDRNNGKFLTVLSPLSEKLSIYTL